jgi:hypothetical protein
MRSRFINAALFMVTMTAAPFAAMADEYYSIQLAQSQFAVTVGNAGNGGYFVGMQQAVSPDYGILPNQSWDTVDLDANWYQMYSEQHGRQGCLTVVPYASPPLTSVVMLKQCQQGDPAQAWRHEESGDVFRFYNAAMPEGSCLTAVPSGEFRGYLTMTNCGQGDVSTELWKLIGTGKQVPN